MSKNIDWSKLSTASSRDADARQVQAQQVDAERDRRAAAGFDFNGKLIQSRDQDRENITGKAMLAFIAILGGAAAGDLRWADPDADFAWITADNSLMPMDAQTAVELGKAWAAYKERLIFAARALKDMAQLPADYTADQYWPA
jgi:hypothetical protein